MAFIRANSTAHSLLSLFGFIWLIVGAVYVFGTSPDFDDDASADYCDHTTYWFAFTMVVIGFVLLGIGAVVFCCACACCMGAVTAAMIGSSTTSVTAMTGENETAAKADPENAESEKY